MVSIWFFKQKKNFMIEVQLVIFVEKKVLTLIPFEAHAWNKKLEKGWCFEFFYVKKPI
jgi:hypothetical protein